MPTTCHRPAWGRQATTLLILTPSDRDSGWTPGRLRAAHALYERGIRTPIARDGQRRYDRAAVAARMRATIYSTPRPVDLDDAMWLLGAGEIPERVAQRLGVTWDAIQTAARRHGTPGQKDRIGRAKAITTLAVAS